jgi:hypothetical protein
MAERRRQRGAQRDPESARLIMLALPALTDPPFDGHVCFGDHLDSRLVYDLPSGLAAAVEADGQPNFVFVRYRGQGSAAGGMLRLGLAWQLTPAGQLEAAQADGWTVRPVPWRRVRVHLVRRVGALGMTEPVGPWLAGTPDGANTTLVRFDLDTADAQILQELLDDQVNVLEVEAQADYTGLVSGVPWLVSFNPRTVAGLLQTTLGTQPRSAADIEAALVGVPTGSQGPLTLSSLAQAAVEPASAQLAALLLPHVVDALFATVTTSPPAWPPVYQLVDPLPVDGTLVLDLSLPRLVTQSATSSWSISALYASLADPQQRARFFPSVQTLEPFASVTVPVECDVPLDPRFLSQVHCEVRFNGPTGTPAYAAFDFGVAPATDAGTHRSFTATYPAMTQDLGLASRLRATLAPPGGRGWPIVLDRGFADCPAPYVDITRAAIGIDFVRVELEPLAADLVGPVRVAIAREPTPTDSPADDPPTTGQLPSLATVELSAASPAAWVALPGVAASETLCAVVEALPRDGADPGSVEIRRGPIVDRQIVVDSADLQVRSPDVVTISLDPVAAAQFAYVAATVAPPIGTPTTHTLTVEHSQQWCVLRPSIFATLQFRYQLLLVPFDADHTTTLPMVMTDWVESQQPDVLLSPTAPLGQSSD